MFKKNKKIIPNKLTKETQKSMKVRIITAIVGLAIVVPTIIFGGWAFLFLVVFLAGFGAFELVRCAKRKYNPILYITTIILVVFLAIFPVFKNVFYVEDVYLYVQRFLQQKH